MKRIFALLLAFGMIIGLFAGCGKNDNESGGTAAAEKKDFKNSKIVVFVSNDSEEIADVINESAEPGGKIRRQGHLYLRYRLEPALHQAFNAYSLGRAVRRLCLGHISGYTGAAA